MNLSIIARVLRQLAIIFVLSVLLVAGYIYYAGKQHQQAAINFWVSNTSLMPSRRKLIGGLSVIGYSSRGPIISPGIAGVSQYTTSRCAS